MDARTLSSRLDVVQVVDVRHPDEWHAGHIDGARHIPVGDLAERAGELDRHRPVVAVCRSGDRSAEAVQWLQGEGFHAENLEGGMLAWAGAGLDSRDGDGGPGSVTDDEPSTDDRQARMRELQDSFLEVVFAAHERFGDREPSEEEMREFLRERLMSEGRTAEEADEFLARMSADD